MSTLPFYSSATLEDMAGSPLAINVPISVWPASARDTDSGRSYTHDGECPVGYIEALEAANVRFSLGDKTYHVVDAQAHDFLPHCSLRLREMRGA